ncbi:hypothetical protein [Pedobacter zeae]|uniref:Uncharacterized protein n=1 Tax=Pedobacter zeae TaxID=1737356 RepID=A0A7W6KBT2_9SPHI|nr:hypothetical protein [Pedobacter zeae]MBB4107702.1 hypothetical protein [Pedobacter zeae]GGG97622.1 hypothetical protein GCM10007422_09500 [Pedobacter zeae]
MEKVKIELSPYDALSILSFCREYVNDELADEPIFIALKKSVKAFEEELTKNLTEDQYEDAKAENQVNRLMGTCPNNYKP